MVHDPTHVFFKLPRPVDRPVESMEPILPLLYVWFVSAFPMRTEVRFRYKYRVASACTLDAHDPKGEHIELAGRLQRPYRPFSLSAKRHAREHLLRPVYGTDSGTVVPLCVLSQGFV